MRKIRPREKETHLDANFVRFFVGFLENEVHHLFDLAVGIGGVHLDLLLT